MKKISFATILLLFTTITMMSCRAQQSTQQVEVRNNQILSAGKQVAVIESICDVLICTFFIRNSEGRNLITIVERDFIDPAEKRDTPHPNPNNGRVFYLRFSFADGRGVAETQNVRIARNAQKQVIAATVVMSNLIQNGELNDDAVRDFIQTHGTRFTDRREQIQSNIHQIIVR